MALFKSDNDNKNNMNIACFHHVSGIDKLSVILEYNFLTPLGKTNRDTKMEYIRLLNFFFVQSTCSPQSG